MLAWFQAYEGCNFATGNEDARRRVQGARPQFKVQSSKFKDLSSRFKDQCSKFKDLSSRFKDLSSKFKDLSSRFFAKQSGRAERKDQGSKFQVHMGL